MGSPHMVVMRSNENKMSDGGRDRASLGIKVWKSSQKWTVQRSAVRSIAWLGFCGLADHVEYEFRLGKHRHVAAVDLKGGCAHALGEETLQIGMHGLILFGDDVPARLRLPGSSPDFRLEQIGFRRALSCPNELLLLLRKVAAEILCAFRAQPDTSVNDFYVGKNVGLREVGLLRLSRFIGVRRERGDVNQPDNTIVSSRAGDNTSAVRVADEDNRTADPAYGFFRHGNVVCRCVEAVLRCNTFIPLCLKGNDQLTEARPIGPEPMAEYNTFLCLWHILSPLIGFGCLFTLKLIA